MSTPFVAVTERLTRVNGIVAGCGQAALLVILHATKGLPTTAAELKALIVQSQNNHQAGIRGNSTPSNLIWLAGQYGQQLTPIDWRNASQYVDAGQPVIVGVNNARVFGGPDTTVEGHYVTLVGRSGRNYLVSDPNTVESETGNFVVYTPEQIAAAHPFWAATTPIPVTGAQADTLGYTFGLPDLSGINNFFQGLGGIVSWVGNPARLVKFLVGVVLIWTALFYGLIKGGAAMAGTYQNIKGGLVESLGALGVA